MVRVMDRPDGLYSWLVALSAAYCTCASIGILRSQGVFFLATLDRFGTTREEASWPYSVFSTCFFLVGPVCGFLGSVYGLQKVLVFGIAISSLGLSSCFFTSGINWLNVSYGILVGTGNGIIYRMAAPIVNQHFAKHRSTAMGITLSGSSVGGFVIPVLVESLLSSFGYHGAFLVVGGFMLNALVAASLMKPPLWLLPRLDAGHPKQQEMSSYDAMSNVPSETVNSNSRFLSEVRKAIGVLKSPVFYLLCASYATVFNSVGSYFTVIVDYAVDQGVQRELAKYILLGFGATELSAKLSLGWITDRGFLDRKTYLLSAMFVNALCVACLPLATDFVKLVSHAVIYGLAYSGSATMFPLLLADYLGPENHSVSFGFMTSLVFPLTLLFPPMVGHFRDRLGHYDGLFYIISSLQFGALLLWPLEPRLRKLSQKSSEKSAKK